MSKEILTHLDCVLHARRNASADESYVASLYCQGVDKIGKKIAEEAAETIMAAKDGDAAHVVKEVADLWFHSLVMLHFMGKSSSDVLTELEHREGLSGHTEKQQRGGQK